LNLAIFLGCIQVGLIALALFVIFGLHGTGMVLYSNAILVCMNAMLATHNFYRGFVKAGILKPSYRHGFLGSSKVLLLTIPLIIAVIVLMMINELGVQSVDYRF